MGILYPSEAMARRWDGALQARLRRAPLEAFLSSRALVPAPAGVSQDSDNLVRATVSIVEAGLLVYFADRERDLAIGQRPVLGHMACLVSLALAQQIAEPDTWRIVALVSTTRLLGPWIGLSAAAMASVATARQFKEAMAKGISPLDLQVMKSACEAVSGNDSGAMTRTSANIEARLIAEGPSADIGPVQDLRELQPGY